MSNGWIYLMFRRRRWAEMFGSFGDWGTSRSPPLPRADEARMFGRFKSSHGRAGGNFEVVTIMLSSKAFVLISRGSLLRRLNARLFSLHRMRNSLAFSTRFLLFFRSVTTGGWWSATKFVSSVTNFFFLLLSSSSSIVTVVSMT